MPDLGGGGGGGGGPTANSSFPAAVEIQFCLTAAHVDKNHRKIWNIHK